MSEVPQSSLGRISKAQSAKQSKDTKSIPPEYQWKTQTGVVMDIHDMDDQHLANSIKMLERNAEAYKQRELSAGYSVWGMLQGEQALWDIQHDIDYLEEMPAQKFLEDAFPVYKHMKRELRRRTKGTDLIKKGRK